MWKYLNINKLSEASQGHIIEATARMDVIFLPLRLFFLIPPPPFAISLLSVSILIFPQFPFAIIGSNLLALLYHSFQLLANYKQGQDISSKNLHMLK